jgi:RNA polymerase sigma-70 factor (ECF subfamily)
MTEQEIITGSIKHDKAALKKLFENYYGKVMGVSLRYADNDEHASLILQRSFEQIYSSIREFPQENGILFEDWIKKIVIANAVKVAREDKSHYRIVSTVVVPDGEAKKTGTLDEDQLMAKINKPNLIAALRKLSPAYRLAYNLSEIDNVPTKEILTLLEISEGTFKSNLSQAGFHLKKALLQL